MVFARVHRWKGKEDEVSLGSGFFFLSCGSVVHLCPPPVLILYTMKLCYLWLREKKISESEIVETLRVFWLEAVWSFSKEWEKGNPNLIEVDDKITTDFIRIRIAPCSSEERVRKGKRDKRVRHLMCPEGIKDYKRYKWLSQGQFLFLIRWVSRNHLNYRSFLCLSDWKSIVGTYYCFLLKWILLKKIVDNQSTEKNRQERLSFLVQFLIL